MKSRIIGVVEVRIKRFIMQMVLILTYFAHQKGDWKKFYEPVDNATLGKGMTGSVFVVTHKKTGKKFACKPLKKVLGNQHMVETLYREISLLAQVFTIHIY